MYTKVDEQSPVTLAANEIAEGKVIVEEENGEESDIEKEEEKG